MAGEVITASILNTHVRDNLKVGRGYAQVLRTGGNFTMNSTAWANTSTTLDLTLAASTGDVVTANMAGLWGNEAVIGCLNVVAVASGEGMSTRTANTDFGWQAWRGHASALHSVGAPASRTMASADISGGNVIMRIRHKTGTAANKTFYATTANGPLYFQVRNQGPHVAP